MADQGGARRTGLGALLRDKAPFLRWSTIRFALGGRSVLRTGQVGDGREEAVRQHVLHTATAGDPDSVLAAFDDFARNRSILMNVGDEKGLLLDAAVVRAKPLLALELGAYCGYSAVRTGRLLPPKRAARLGGGQCRQRGDRDRGDRARRTRRSGRGGGRQDR
ncbi:hypothetical protein APR11_000475 [Nocardia amikacinitolerans]|nr:hypothetical protein [Nocardia amikacinitolerans]